MPLCPVFLKDFAPYKLLGSLRAFLAAFISAGVKLVLLSKKPGLTLCPAPALIAADRIACASCGDIRPCAISLLSLSELPPVSAALCAAPDE